MANLKSYCEASNTRNECDYCGLPLKSARSAELPSFCCYGCRFAAAVTSEHGETAQTRWTMTKLGLSIFFAMSVMVFAMALWTRDVYQVETNAATEGLFDLFRFACLLFTAPVLLMLGIPLLFGAVADLRSGVITTDFLLAMGVIAAYVHSLITTVTGQGHVYFEVVCMVLVAVTLGRWLEATGKLKSAEALRSLTRLLPDAVRVVRRGREEVTELGDVEVGEIVHVLPGERIPLDGRIHRHGASIDEQIVTGEIRPVDKRTGDRVFGGTLNLDGDLFVAVSATAAASTVQQLVDQVVRAGIRPGRNHRIADVVAARFVPAIITVAALTFAVHWSLADTFAALSAALAVLLIACPCALGVATPLAIWAALGRASENQVLFRDSDTVSRLARISCVCFDKTGTLTDGRVDVDRLVLERDVSRTEFLRRVHCLTASSLHPLTRAIHRLESRSGCRRGDCEVTVLSGQGLTAVLPELIPATPHLTADVGGSAEPGRIWLGSPALMNDAQLKMGSECGPWLQKAREAGNPIVCAGWHGRVQGIFVFREQLRDEAQATIANLRQLGIECRVLSGDPVLNASVSSLEIDYQTNLLPADKLAAIEAIQCEPRLVAMVGDGINDAPALRKADVGVAMGCGADTARDIADVCLLGDHLSRLPWAISLARTTERTIRQNLFWAFFYNVCGVAVAAAGWLNPIVAAIAMVGSSLFVISNSLRLFQFDVDADDRPALAALNKGHLRTSRPQPTSLPEPTPST